MRTYLYGLILDRDAHLVPGHIAGIDASPLRTVHCDGLQALVSSIERAPERRLDDVRAHDHALQCVVHHGVTAMATRFGQTFDSDDEARRHVREHGGQARRALESWSGCVEMRLLLAHKPAPSAPDRESAPAEDVGPGRAYLEGLRSRRSERVPGVAVRAAFGDVVRAERVEALPGPAQGVAVCHLIDRSREREYREALATFPALADAVVVGPLALYSFTEPDA